MEKQRDEILRLKNDNRRLELQKTALSLHSSRPQEYGFACARDQCNECEVLRKDEANLRQMITILEVMEERDELRKHEASVEAKAQNKVDKALKLYDYMQVAYWDCTVPKLDKLQQELDLKNGKVPPEEQPRPERNPRVDHQFVLRCALGSQRGTLRGFDSSHVPSVYHEPGFRPGWISAGMDALRVLRPMGWEAV